MTDLFQALDATWPAAARHQAGGWLVGEGRGGGKRVSSAIALSGDALSTIDLAEAAHAHLGQPPLFCLRPGQEALDNALAARGYAKIDPVVIYRCATDRIADAPPERLTTFPIWPPLAIMAELWEEEHIDAARLAVMDRVTGPRTAILGRMDDRAAGAAFVGIAGDVAMVHALHVDPAMRRKGLARNLMRAAGQWARAAGASHLALAVTEANTAANGLYRALGMERAAHYHYRAK
jgi:GNAT superfamily N-acetyltransferase